MNSTVADVLAGNARWVVAQGDCIEWLKSLPDDSVQCCVTSPPYFHLRDYGHPEQIGLEDTPAAFVAKLVEVFHEVRRVLKDDGTLWANIGDSYAGSWGTQSRGDDYPSNLEGGSMLSARQIKSHPKGTQTGSLKNTPGLKPKDLMGVPWRLAFALQDDGWYLRSDIIWAKPNPMPESVEDRCTKAHEYLFMLAKSEAYYFDADAIAEQAVSTGGGASFGKQRHDATGTGAQSRTYDRPVYEMRNKRSVWTVPTKPYKGAHFAVMPAALVEPCILAGTRPGDVVIEPFAGSGTVLEVAVSNGRRAIGSELNPEYVKLIHKRMSAVTPPMPGFDLEAA